MASCASPPVIRNFKGSILVTLYIWPVITLIFYLVHSAWLAEQYFVACGISIIHFLLLMIGCLSLTNLRFRLVGIMVFIKLKVLVYGGIVLYLYFRGFSPPAFLLGFMTLYLVIIGQTAKSCFVKKNCQDIEATNIS